MYFSVLRTKRLTVQLKELTIGQAIDLSEIPANLNELSCTKFLEKIIESVEGIQDVKLWTAQERMIAVAHYLALTNDNKEPDFKIGNGNYSDYLQGMKEYNDEFNGMVIGTVNNEEYKINYLNGKMLESIERVNGEVKGIKDRKHWMFGAMACQLFSKGTPEFNSDLSDSEFDTLLVERMNFLRDMPSSLFEQLSILWRINTDKMTHLFCISFDDNGLVALPKGGIEGVALPSARFPVRSVLSPMAL